MDSRASPLSWHLQSFAYVGVLLALAREVEQSREVEIGVLLLMMLSHCSTPCTAPSFPSYMQAISKSHKVAANTKMSLPVDSSSAATPRRWPWRQRAKAAPPPRGGCLLLKHCDKEPRQSLKISAR